MVYIGICVLDVNYPPYFENFGDNLENIVFLTICLLEDLVLSTRCNLYFFSCFSMVAPGTIYSRKCFEFFFGSIIGGSIKGDLVLY